MSRLMISADGNNHEEVIEILDKVVSLGKKGFEDLGLPVALEKEAVVATSPVASSSD